jgi:hypothetical protein
MSKEDHIKKKIIIKKFHNTKVYHLHNSYHLGDNVFNFILFYMIKDYLEKKNVKIFYYAKKEYLNQLKDFLSSKNIILSSLELKPKSSIEIWVNETYFNYRHDRQQMPINFNKYYIIFFNNVLKKLYINIEILKFYYLDTDLITRYDNLSEKYKQADILILNSTPLSGQYDYKKDEWDNYILNLDKKFKILTTTKVNNLICTTDDSLNIKDIAAISSNVKVIIAINSGVVPGLLNKYTLQNIKKAFIFDTRCYYSYPNFENRNNINDITMDELETYIK